MENNSNKVTLFVNSFIEWPLKGPSKSFCLTIVFRCTKITTKLPFSLQLVPAIRVYHLK